MDGGAIARAAQHLREGGVVAFPTETVYGLGADARRQECVARIFAIKGRPAHNPLIVHVTDEAAARELSTGWSDEASRLARAFWPGPLTIVVPAGPMIPRLVTGGGETVALRAPDHPAAQALLRAFGGPIVGPSANRSGSLSPTTAAHVRQAFAREIESGEIILLDGGPCRAGIESTVVSVSGLPGVPGAGVPGAGAPRVLRRGVVSPQEIEAVLGRRVEVGLGEGAPPAIDAPPAAAALPSPGLLDRHYAPRTPCRLFEAWDWPEVLDAAGPCVVLTHERVRVVEEPHRLIRLPMDAPGYAAGLYAALHEADAFGLPTILIEQPRGAGALWDAVRDRLSRASAPA